MDTLPLITVYSPELVMCPSAAAAKGAQKHGLPCVQQHITYERTQIGFYWFATLATITDCAISSPRTQKQCQHILHCMGRQ